MSKLMATKVSTPLSENVQVGTAQQCSCFPSPSAVILISYTHKNVNVFTETRQNNSHFYCHITTTRAFVSEVSYEVGYETLLRTLQQKYLFSRMYILLLLKWWKLYFLRNDHTTFLTCFNFNSKFLLFDKKSEIDVSCLRLITRYTTQNVWGKRKYIMRLF